MPLQRQSTGAVSKTSSQGKRQLPTSLLPWLLGCDGGAAGNVAPGGGCCNRSISDEVDGEDSAAMIIDEDGPLDAPPVPELTWHPEGPPTLIDVGVELLRKPSKPFIRKAASDANRDVPSKPLSWRDDLSPTGKALIALQAAYPYLSLASHYLYRGIRECENALNDKEEGRAAEILVRTEQEVHQEEDTLAAAFNLFRPGGRDCLAMREVTFMLEYLGFPSESTNVWELIGAVDMDNDSMISLVEFQMYVGKMGGSFRMFELRRASVRQQQLSTPTVSRSRTRTSGLLGRNEHADDIELLRTDLQQAGLDNSAQAYWRLMVPFSELQAAADLAECQKCALQQVRTLAKRNHERALAPLQKRMQALGFKGNELWMTLSWIREVAPIIIHVNCDLMLSAWRLDTHYRNQFETATSGGLLNTETRKGWERNLFTAAYDGEEVEPFDRVKYGVLNVMNDHRGVARTEQYGDSYLILKDVRLRCTFSPEDSSNCRAENLAVLDFFAHELMEYNDKELLEVVKVASGSGGVIGDSCVVGFLKYKEAQVHGEIDWKRHVSRLVADDRHKSNYMAGMLTEVCAKHGWALSYMSDWKTHMEKERCQKMSVHDWKQRVRSLAVPESRTEGCKERIAAGYCIKGCGRLVRPGKTKGGGAFATCCRGCVAGFGHDADCCGGEGKVQGPGLCKHGCGRPIIANRRSISGFAFDSCCRGCARSHGASHDVTCGCEENANIIVEAGMCRMGCGRMARAAEGGKTFSTCCRACACGKGHSAACKKM